MSVPINAINLYNGCGEFIKKQCKLNEEFISGYMNDFKLNATESVIFRQLIETDGQYHPAPDVLSSNELMFRHNNINKNMASAVDKKEKKQENDKKEEKKEIVEDDIDIPPNNKLHWKLRNLSCLQNRSNGILSKNRARVAVLLNENIDLEKVSMQRIHDMVYMIASIDKDIESVQTKLTKECIKTLKSLNIENEIQKNIGTTNITHCIDRLSFNFVGWRNEFKKSISEIENIKKEINNALILLSLGVIDKDGKLVAVLSGQDLNVKTGIIVTYNQGTALFDYLKKRKRGLKQLNKDWNETNKLIKKKNENKLYQKKLTSKRKGVKTLTEKERAKRHKDRVNSRNQKATEKKGKAANSTKKRKRSDEDNGPRNDSYFTPIRARPPPSKKQKTELSKKRSEKEEMDDSDEEQIDQDDDVIDAQMQTVLQETPPGDIM